MIIFGKPFKIRYRIIILVLIILFVFIVGCSKMEFDPKTSLIRYTIQNNK